MIKLVSGDILRTTSEYLAHGVAIGSQESPGTGLALKISSRWPEVQKHFRQFTRGNKFQGGDLFVVAPARNRPGVIYIATQPDLYHATLPFLNRGLRKLARYCVKNKIARVSPTWTRRSTFMKTPGKNLKKQLTVRGCQA
jgi:O-acetyl-ADP-ribose deacetylase (regulator of RNase III)